MLHRTLHLYRSSFSGLSREIWYLALVILINRAGTMVLPFLTLYLTKARDFTLTEAGLVMSSFGAGSLLGVYIGGWLTDRIGYYRVQQITLGGSGLLFFALPWVEGFGPMCAMFFALSVVADAYRPANQVAVAHFSRPENRARSFGLNRLAVNLGFSLGPVLGGLLIATLGYRWLFVIDGLTSISAAVIFSLLLPAVHQLAGSRSTDGAAGAAPPVRGPSAYRNGQYLLFVVAVMLSAIGFMQVFSTMPVFLEGELGYSEGQVGMLIAFNGLLIVLCEMPLVHAAERRFRILRSITVGMALYGLAYLLLPLAGIGVVVPLAFLFLLTFGEMLSMPFSSTFAADLSTDDRRGQFMALLGVGYALAFIIAPSLGLWWAERFGYSSLWFLSAGLCGAASLLVAFLDQRARRLSLQAS